MGHRILPHRRSTYTIIIIFYTSASCIHLFYKLHVMCCYVRIKSIDMEPLFTHSQLAVIFMISKIIRQTEPFYILSSSDSFWWGRWRVRQDWSNCDEHVIYPRRGSSIFSIISFLESLKRRWTHLQNWRTAKDSFSEPKYFKSEKLM